MTYISKCDLIVYDLHSGNPEDIKLALGAMNKKRADDGDTPEKTIILISSLLAWDATARNLEEIRSPEDIEEEEREAAMAKAKAEAEARAAKRALSPRTEEGGVASEAAVEVTSAAEAAAAEEGKEGEGEEEGKEGEEGAEEGEEEVEEE